jgi:ribosomal protein S12 methylthiotransferase accessory factor
MTMTPSRELLELCAQALLSHQSSVEQPEHVRSLLKMLEYDSLDGDAISIGADARHSAKLLQAATQLVRLFQLRAPDAPGLVFFGAEVDPSGIFPGGTDQRRLSASGAGLSFRAAFEGCVGESIELLSQFECTSDCLSQAEVVDCTAEHELALTDTVAILLQEAGRPVNTEIDWIIAQRALAKGKMAFPADICLRRGAGHILTPPWPLSIGCAAGTSFESAMLHGLLELIERDAAALWWRGGIRGHVIPLDAEAARRALGLLIRARGTRQRRRSWLLDITTDLGVPTVAAVSVNGDGHGFACGLAARLSLTQATEAAILEMCQMELAHMVVAAKRHESGDSALNAYDKAHLRRDRELNVHDCVLLHPLPPRVDQLLDIKVSDAATALNQLLEHLVCQGVETFMIDLTRPSLGIPVARVLCPALEKEPSKLIGSRLRAAIRSTGGGDAHTHGIPLM